MSNKKLVGFVEKKKKAHKPCIYAFRNYIDRRVVNSDILNFEFDFIM